jgi:hypothetical protein
MTTPAALGHEWILDAGLVICRLCDAVCGTNAEREACDGSAAEPDNVDMMADSEEEVDKTPARQAAYPHDESGLWSRPRPGF